MSLRYLVGVVILVSIAVTSSVSVGANPPESTNSVLRILRTRAVADSGAEERMGGGIAVPTSEKLAALLNPSKVTDEQLKKWLEEGKSADVAFYRMSIAKSRKWLFNIPQFSKWVQYADDLSATAAGKGTSAIATLTAHFGDEKLYNILKAGEMSSTTKELASRLRTDQFERWVSIREDPSKIYTLYGLNYAGKLLLRHPEFSAWAKYVDDLNAKHEGTVSMIPTLRKYYSDGILLKMAEAAKGVDEMESMGLKLENAFVQFWINNKKTPANIFTGLHLEATTKMLESPLFSFLVKYTDAYNVKFPQKKMTMIETLTTTFGDENVAKMLAAAKTKDGKINKIAAGLEADQSDMWLRSGESVDEVYKLLNLPYRKDLLSDFDKYSVFNTWVKYMNTFSIENPEKVSELLSTMTTKFADRPLMQIFQAAKKFPSMENVADKLQLQQAEKIFATGVSPYKAFTIVALDDVGDSVLTSPLFTKWMSYVKDFNKKHPNEKESWFLPLRTKYQDQNLATLIETARKDPNGAKIADLVEKARMNNWLTYWKHKPADAFQLLNLNEAENKMLSNPSFQLWLKYLNDFNKRYPYEKTTMIDSIRASYSDLRLMQILDEAVTVPNTKKMAKSLENALLGKWRDEKVTVAHLEKSIGDVPSAKLWIDRYAETLNRLS